MVDGIKNNKINPAKGYYQMTGKEGNYIIRLIELCLDYPEESKISLIAVKELMESAYKENLRLGRKWTEKDKIEHGKKMKQKWKEHNDAYYTEGETK